MKLRLSADGQRGSSAALFLDGVDITGSSREVIVRAAVDSIVTAEIGLIPKGLDIEVEARCQFHITVPEGCVLIKYVLDNGRERWECLPKASEVIES